MKLTRRSERKRDVMVAVGEMLGQDQGAGPQIKAFVDHLLSQFRLNGGEISEAEYQDSVAKMRAELPQIKAYLLNFRFPGSN
jgi:hypothetical protein